MPKLKSTVDMSLKEKQHSSKKSVKHTRKLKKVNVSSVQEKPSISLSGCPQSSHTLLVEKVQSSVEALLKYDKMKSKRKSSSLFMEERQPIYLTVECIKIPQMPKKNFRFCLVHPLVDTSSDVCLFVPDLKKGKRQDHEPTREHFKDILQKNDISGISEVMPLRQVRVEYDQYELKRRLVNQFDLFLADGRISGHMLHLLGKEVYKKRKLPIPVDLRVKDLKKEVERALSKTLMMMHGKGNNSSLKIAHTKLSVNQITENIMGVAEGLAKRYPGGWNNIRSIHIHVQDQPLIPVYMNFKSSNEVKVPVVKPIVPKNAVPVEGELSTYPGTKVIVMPSGEVIVKRIKPSEAEYEEIDFSDSDWEGFESDLEVDMEEDDDNDDGVDNTPSDNKTSEMENAEEKEDPSSDEHEDFEGVTEAAENAYLSEWASQWNEKVKDTGTRMKRKQNSEITKEEKRKKKKTASEKSPSFSDKKVDRQKKDKIKHTLKKSVTIKKVKNVK